MLKSYDKRVESTYKLLETYIDLVVKDARQIGSNKKKADLAVATQKEFTLTWKLDKEKYEELPFKGYEAAYKPSQVSGAPRLYYDRNKPYTRNIKEWNHFLPDVKVQKPVAYIIPKAWTKVIELLKLNNVVIKELREDAVLPVESYYIADFKTVSHPFEGHYLHSNVQLDTRQQQLAFYKGDYIVYVNQPQNRYIVETLEPQATDSFFNWNFFDSILGQKEHYSAYVFEDTAAELLEKDPELKAKLDKEKLKYPDPAAKGDALLEFVYKNSDYYEKTHLRYPIARLQNDISISLK